MFITAWFHSYLMLFLKKNDVLNQCTDNVDVSGSIKYAC